jgi:hypothetical protein
MALEDDIDDASAHDDEACGCLKPHSRIFLNNYLNCLYRAVCDEHSMNYSERFY